MLPLPVAVASTACGHLAARHSWELFFAIHWYLEMAVLISLLAAIACLIRLWPGRGGRGWSWGFVTNACLVVAAGALVVWVNLWGEGGLL